jgi:hypothetical protein
MRQIFDDHGFKRAIQIGVFLVVGCCILSQLMMQMGGGERDQPMDLTDQLPDDVDQDGLVFEDGFPPFISSAGALMPEKAVFDFGLFTGGVIMIFLSFEIYHRTNPEGKKRKIANIVSLISGTVIGFSMMQIVAHPFNTSIMMHIFWAMNIFWGAQLWIAALTYARGELDAEVTWKGRPIHRVRWAIFAVAVISFQAMTLMVATGHLVESAIFEWTLTFSAEAMMLSLIPTITSAASS